MTFYDEKWLARETEFYKEADSLRVRFVSPARLKISRNRQGKLGNGRPYLQDKGQLAENELERKIFQALVNLAPELTTLKPEHPGWLKSDDTLFWTENTPPARYNSKPVYGGVLGTVFLEKSAVGADTLPLLVLGQYYGIGEMRSYGLGRYRLEHSDGRGTKRPRLFSDSILQRAGMVDNLEKAWQSMCLRHPSYWQRRWGGKVDWTWIDRKAEQQQVFDIFTMAGKLAQADYEAAELEGFILQQPGRHPRPLAVPPLPDRLAQRAVLEVMTPDLERVMLDESYGYRRGRSRQFVRDKVQLLIRRGYKWLYETDIDSFFDSIPFEVVENRLLSFFPDDPAVKLIMDWVRAPVNFKGRKIIRTMGLPQGSPISPMLANLVLSDLDADLEALDMKLLRFADDLVVLCKSRKRAELAAQRVEKSLAELGLAAKEKKTRLTTVDQGFTFLGYTFLNELVVESHRSGKDSAPELVTMDNIPPRSWLAMLLNKEPSLLDALRSGSAENRAKGKTTAKRNQHETGSGDNFFGRTIFVAGKPKSLKSLGGKLTLYNQAKEKIRQEPFSGLHSVVLLGRHYITTPCLTRVMREGAAVHFVSSSGKYLGVAAGADPNREGAGLWQAQAAAVLDKKIVLKTARQLVLARINNQTEVIRQRKRGGPAMLADTVADLKKLYPLAEEAANLESLRGCEGRATALYYRALSAILPEEFQFKTRTKHPALTPFCSLLDLGYSSLRSYAGSALRIAGLHPWTGFYHQGAGTHQTLASDMMEPFRHVVERNALTLIKRGQLRLDHFQYSNNNGCRLTTEGFRIFFPSLIDRFNIELSSRSEDTKKMLPEHLYAQALSLVQNIRDQQTELWVFRL